LLVLINHRRKKYKVQVDEYWTFKRPLKDPTCGESVDKIPFFRLTPNLLAFDWVKRKRKNLKLADLISI